MKKKNISFIMVFMILAGIMLACNAFAADKPTLSIQYLRHWVPAADAVVERRAKEWGQKNGFDVNFDSISEKDLEFKISIAVENKTGPDIIMIRRGAPILYQDALLDVTSIAKANIAANGSYFPANQAQNFTGKKWVAIPWYSVVTAWMYRIDLFNKAGLKVPETYAELGKVAQALTQPDQNIYGFGQAYSRSQDGNKFTQTVLWSYGMQLTDKTGKKVMFNSKGTLAGLQFMADLYRNYKCMPPGVTGWDESANNKAWAAGQLAMTPNAASVYFDLKTSNPTLAENTGHALWPKGPAGRPIMVDTYSLAIMKYTKYPEEAKKLLAYITNGDGYREFYTAGQGFQCPTMPKFAKLPIYNDPKIRPIVDSMPFGRVGGWPGPVTRASAAVENEMIFPDMLQRVVVDGLTPKAALDEATKRIEEIYKKYQ